MYSYHTGPTARKAEKEMPVMSARGNKSVVAGLLGALIACSILLGIVISEKKIKIRLYERAYSAAVGELEKKNSVEMNKGAGPVE